MPLYEYTLQYYCTDATVSMQGYLDYGGRHDLYKTSVRNFRYAPCLTSFALQSLALFLFGLVTEVFRYW